MKKTLLVTSLLAASVFASAANAANLNISGQIKNFQCSADAKSATITMPEINIKDLGDTVGAISTASTTDITINLTNCPPMTQKVKVEFTGTADQDNPKALALNNVEGIALALFEEDGAKEIAINTTANEQSLTGSPTHELKYKVKYVTTDTVFKPGKAEAVLGFDVSYN
ncbi:type 1 fimbrial protein [Yersinia ruckeri]|uniref:fimbrial protein n=1 Tax=Yersinia ruckeri TaxID=29486 RepID=UPI0011A589FF|nr:fimbrial protein [Yersinia ruckeri]EKN3346301.1 type 1 fimbrial protein [Yersinia ruckeri]EKN3361689.1 type 1 fimbrial protein [Yersinia ruckeri]EKN4201213.1 type 1 fimbrial protein [Yersinia ruckeri]EKN4208640.1 type 1 fimbrial protein [Yersinia ruckeri]EKN4705226.1 type 1 fimbrial protein [Yersinia ruckeri]